jgi:hypothetical protein
MFTPWNKKLPAAFLKPAFFELVVARLGCLETA